jgi:hypothetical protein
VRRVEALFRLGVPLAVLVDRPDEVDAMLLLAGDEVLAADLPRVDQVLAGQEVALG